jgi:hypothetical protein
LVQIEDPLVRNYLFVAVLKPKERCRKSASTLLASKALREIGETLKFFNSVAGKEALGTLLVMQALGIWTIRRGKISFPSQDLSAGVLFLPHAKVWVQNQTKQPTP